MEQGTQPHTSMQLMLSVNISPVSIPIEMKLQ